MDDPLLVLVTGPPASGKSTLARAIAARLRCPLLAKDTIKEPLLEVLGAGDRAWSRRLSDASFAALFAIARELRDAALPLVLEGNFRPGEHEAALRPLAGTAGLTQVLCRVPQALRLDRLAARAADPARHRGHGDGILAQETALPGGFLELPGRRIEHDGASADGGRLTLARLFPGDQ